VKNVIGVLEGKGSRQRNGRGWRHYDHLGYGGFGSRAKAGQKDEIHHGADDNASGTTAVMELTRRFGAMKNREGRRLVFMAFTAEERGLIGSRFYTREPCFRSKTRQPCLTSTWSAAQGGSQGRKETEAARGRNGYGQGFDGLVAKLNPGSTWSRTRAFRRERSFLVLPAEDSVLFFWTGTHEDYHRPTDTADKINVQDETHHDYASV